MLLHFVRESKKSIKAKAVVHKTAQHKARARLWLVASHLLLIDKKDVEARVTDREWRPDKGQQPAISDENVSCQLHFDKESQ